MNREQILAEIAEAYYVRERRPWEFTRREFAAAIEGVIARRRRFWRRRWPVASYCRSRRG